MSFRDRLNRLEGKRGGESLCPECGDRILWVEIDPEGNEHYPEAPPCPECGSRPEPGAGHFPIRRIEIRA